MAYSNLCKALSLPAALTVALSSLSPLAAYGQSAISPAEARTIAKEATIYGFPLVDNYRVLHSYFVDKTGPEFKAPWNQLNNVDRVFTPDDKAIQTPNSDTPYSQLGADLRAEPLVLSVPKVEDGRYYSLQFIDLYTYNFAYVGSRASGNEAGNFLLAGPNWQGPTPAGIKQVIRAETDFAFVLYRTQLTGAGDIGAVKQVQAGYKVQPLSSFLGQAAPQAAPAISFNQPPTPEEERSSLKFFDTLNFVLQFAPAPASEVALRERLSKIGVVAGQPFAADKLDAPLREAISAGMVDAWKTLAQFKTNEVDTGKRTAADGFGSREFLGDDYLARMASAAFGIYGNSKEEALYPTYFVDAKGQPLNAAKHSYTLHFAADALPPVHAFWSLTMYELPASLLVANPLNRYLINSAMLDQLKRDPDGGLTLYVQHQSPGKDKESNWLPAPNGPFWTTLRLYWPKPAALNHEWQQPPLQPTK
jgi:hypothetical protein